ncbi:alpha-2-HS-glycoprotein [Python bivittatus]|uniref:Alpha-2-HS-glycoprotein n=1 Tax=Python bivittatus TaxID=176946 RepID=A0A9F2WAQ5_PYTBI|nr:alpha-2-HS-glycoprotein [Python bivittatus]
MNSLIALVLLGQILGCTLSHHLLPQSDCNSEEAEHYAEEGVHYINTHNLHGYKQTLNIIKDLHVLPRRPHGKVIFTELNLLETRCHVLDPTPVENCTVRTQEEHAVEADCDVKLLSDEGVTKVVAVKCHSSPDSVEDVKKLGPNYPILLPLNDPRVVEVVEYVLHKHNEQQPDHVFEVLEITRGQHKHEPESYYVEFVFVETNCSEQESHDAHHDCHPKAAADAHVGFCKATVFRAHDATGKLTDEKFESDCVLFDQKVGETHVHLIEHHLGKNIPSPGHGHTVLDLAHSHNDTNASHESHSAEVLPEVAAPVVKRDVSPTLPPDDHLTPPVKLCPGKVHHFKV